MTLALSDSARPTAGVRPFDPARDIGAVTDVIEVAFVDELGPQDRAILRDFRLLQLVAPALWLAARLFPDFDAVFGGFVWVEDGHIVGTVTLTRLGDNGWHWLISNVGVLPSYRGRGIASALMAAAIDQARGRGGRLLTLQVRSQNETAYRLYRRLGFRLMEQTAILERPARPLPPLDAPPIPLRAWKVADADRVLALSQLVVPATYQSLIPLRRSEFRLEGETASEGPLLAWLRGQQTYCLAVPDGEEFAALARLKARTRGGMHQMELSVHPAWRGRLEPSLLAQTMGILARHGQRPTLAEIRPSEEGVLRALGEMEFKHLYTLDRLGLTLT